VTRPYLTPTGEIDPRLNLAADGVIWLLVVGLLRPAWPLALLLFAALVPVPIALGLVATPSRDSWRVVAEETETEPIGLPSTWSQSWAV